MELISHYLLDWRAQCHGQLQKELLLWVTCGPKVTDDSILYGFDPTRWQT